MPTRVLYGHRRKSARCRSRVRSMSPLQGLYARARPGRPPPANRGDAHSGRPRYMPPRALRRRAIDPRTTRLRHRGARSAFRRGATMITRRNSGRLRRIQQGLRVLRVRAVAAPPRLRRAPAESAQRSSAGANVRRSDRATGGIDRTAYATPRHCIHGPDQTGQPPSCLAMSVTDPLHESALNECSHNATTVGRTAKPPVLWALLQQKRFKHGRAPRLMVAAS